MAIIRDIHSILIDAPVAGLTVAELGAAYAHNLSLLSNSSITHPPLDKNPLGFNNFLELLICNCDYFVTQWDAASGEPMLLLLLQALVFVSLHCQANTEFVLVPVRLEALLLKTPMRPPFPLTKCALASASCTSCRWIKGDFFLLVMILVLGVVGVVFIITHLAASPLSSWTRLRRICHNAAAAFALWRF
jgi:hypothetical protein